MKAIRIRRPFLTLFIITAVLSLFLAIPSSAATKRKLMKSYVTKDAKGNITDKGEHEYDSKGNTKKSTFWYYYDGNVSKSVTTYKRTYWKGTRILKKYVMKSGDNYTSTSEYNKKGVIKKSTSVSKYDGKKETETTEYKTKGSHIKSYVRKNDKGEVIGKGTYNSKGNLESSTYYDSNGKAHVTTYKYTYKNGILRKEVEKSGDYTYSYFYSSKGEPTKQVTKGPDGTMTSTYKNKYKNGYLVSRKVYVNGKFDHETTYKYTSKSYKIG